MRLKRLELQGYKTFATRTEFLFDGAITAIVGPNGSGKSNCADAIRWVLGEQSFRTLRGKSTEDMIFAGSAQRARLGMASASLTFDNADGWLPIDFSEVTLTRRAYRSGENEYLLNGTRVRLRDITELLARSGLARRSYTVIGQGLVDAVLSLRPEERRTLFEEASGITLYQSKRTDALARLEETHSNLLRVNDIVNEIGPLLRRLEREAERAQRHALLNRELEGLLRTWYGYRWHQEQQELRRAREVLAARRAAMEQRRAALGALDARAIDLRARHAALRRELSAWRQESGDLQRQMEEVQRNLAVWQERTRLLAGQSAEFRAEIDLLGAQARAAAGRLDQAGAELARVEEALRGREAEAAQAQDALRAVEGERAELSRRLAQAQSRVLALSGQAADARNRLEQIGERRAALAADRATHDEARLAQEAQATSLQRQIESLAARQAAQDVAGRELQAELGRVEHDIAAGQARQSELRTALPAAQRAHERLQARYDSLSRLRDEGEGLYAGVRAVLLAAAGREPPARSAGRSGNSGLRGILGTVAQLIQVPADYEVAVEVALGGHVQDLVVESWADAEAAIAHLKAGERGRATFLPLDTVRPSPRIELPRDAVRANVLGVAAALVSSEPRLAGVVDLLLGRTVIARDLPAARLVFERLHGGFQVVTLAGELLRSSGAVTGGQGRGATQGQVLAREREWRDLPGLVTAARVELDQVERSLAEAQAAEEQARGRANRIQVQRRAVAGAAAAVEAERRGLERDADRAGREAAWHRQLLSQLQREAAELDGREAGFRDSLARLSAEAQTAEAQVAALQADLDRVRGESLYQRLSEARTAAAVARETWEHRAATIADLRTGLDQLQAQAQARQKRQSVLEGEQEELSNQIHSATHRQLAVQGRLDGLAQEIGPAEAEMGSVEAALEGLEQEEASTRARLREAETVHSEAQSACSQQQDRLERLQRQLAEDFDVLPAAGGPLSVADQLRLPLGDEVAPLPLIEELPEGLEEEIQYVRGQLKRVGPFNPNAPSEYAEVSQRYTFLTTQAADLEEASRSLRAVIAELDDVMRREFQSTFKSVAAHFKDNFKRLFGGGTAQLALTDPDDVTNTGIDISAQPPGKRPQTLALLSGGERALTAVALIFAILEVNPPPFCILDEVDAMLDEANVGRFRQALDTLNRNTQFIVITHNRGTIQAANTIYGVSMGDDSVSQVISLRLDGDRIAAV